jgi:hypothetical protein
MSHEFKYNLETNEPFRFDYDTKDILCVLCKDIYSVYDDPFVSIIDTDSFIEITFELCLKCIRSFINCYECNRKLEEPWDKIYFNVTNKIYYCSCCYNDKRNKNYKNCNLEYCVSCSNNRRLNCKKV